MGDFDKGRADWFHSVTVVAGSVYHRELGDVFWKVGK